MRLFQRTKDDSDTPRRRQSPAIAERALEAELDERYSFRRNRTLTGSASSLVVSTNEAGAQLKSARVHTHELARKRRHVGLLLVLTLAGAGLFYYLTSQFTASVAVTSANTTLHVDAVYGRVIQDYFSRWPLQRFRFAINTEQLDEYVQSRTPEVEAIRVGGSAGFGVSEFALTFRQPIAGWTINGSAQYVDAAGISFGRNYFPLPNVQVIDNSGARPQEGQAVASNRFLGFVGRVVGSSATLAQYKVIEVVIPAGTTRQVDIKLEGIGYPVKFSIDRGAGEQVEDMARAIRWLQASNITPEYLDVRVGGRVFYK